jgi:hypothetical protein
MMKLWCFLFATFLCSNAYSANPEPVTVNVTFVAPITITEVADLNFGLVSTDIINETVIIQTDGTRGSTNNALLLGAGLSHPADVTITATVGLAVTIVVDSLGAGTGYTLSLPTCKYGAASEAACSSLSTTSLASATMLIGMTLTGNNNDVGSATAVTSSFNVTMTYN